MPLAQIAEPWPTVELVQLDTEVRKCEINGLLCTCVASFSPNREVPFKERELISFGLKSGLGVE